MSLNFPSFSEAINQLANITLNRLGVDINSLPFWLSVFGYPLVMFEVFTKHIATAINVLLRKAHMKTMLLIRVVFQLTITLSILTIVALTALYHSEYASIVGNISKPILTTTFKYLIAVTFIVTTILLLSSLSYLTGQGNQVAGIGFISSTTGLFIESVQNF